MNLRLPCKAILQLGLYTNLKDKTERSQMNTNLKNEKNSNDLKETWWKYIFTCLWIENLTSKSTGRLAPSPGEVTVRPHPGSSGRSGPTMMPETKPCTFHLSTSGELSHITHDLQSAWDQHSSQRSFAVTWTCDEIRRYAVQCKINRVCPK